MSAKEKFADALTALFLIGWLIFIVATVQSSFALQKDIEDLRKDLHGALEGVRSVEREADDLSYRTADFCGSIVSRRVRVSHYSDWFEGKRRADGKVYHQRSITVANRDLPFGTVVFFVYRGRFAVGIVQDRGPYFREDMKREFDVSLYIADQLGLTEKGVDEVEVLYRKEGER